MTSIQPKERCGGGAVQGSVTEHQADKDKHSCGHSGKTNKPAQRERRKDHVQPSGMRRQIQRRPVGMMQ